MIVGQITPREREVIHDLLLNKGITTYEIFDPVNEGKSLPGSTYPCEIETISGDIVTPSAVYNFWLDWFDGHYTLGDEEGFWREADLGTWRVQDRLKILEIQQRLQQEGGNAS